MKKILIFIIILGLSYFLYYYFVKNDEPEKFIYEDILTNTEKEYVNVDTFTIYGKYLNFKGTLPSNEKYSLVLKNNEIEKEIKISCENNKFTTSDYINDGINLEKMDIGDYIILLKNNETGKYYNLLNKTNYHDNEYYTITKNKKNNLITFPSETFNEIKYWKINVVSTILPENIYDIVIDPGHGGVDTGAGNGKYHESKFTLDYAKALYDALKEEGLKVKLTRDTDVKIDHYGEGSRTGIPYEVKAKLMFSIHLNSSNSKKQKGVEIYKAYYDNNDYAKLIAANITKEVGTSYSNNPQNKVMDGVYMRVYSPKDIEGLAKDAKKDGYEPYDLGNDITYYYFIRETGGIMTKAFSDGRNPKYKANPYRNYNQGVEAYLCELAYISQSEDLKLVLNKKDRYIKALKNSILSYAEMDEKVVES